MRGRGGGVQTPWRRQGTKNDGNNAVAGRIPGSPLFANDGCESGRGGSTARGARVNGSERF